MFETVDRALIPTHTELQINGRKAWQYIFRVTPTPWLHCEIAYAQDGMTVTDVYFVNDIYSLWNLLALEDVELRQLSVVSRDNKDHMWRMKDVEKIWRVNEPDQYWYALQFDANHFFSASDWRIENNRKLADLINKELVLSIE